MRLGLVVGTLIVCLAVGQARAYCPKRFIDSAPGVEQTIWQPGAGNSVRVAFSDTLDATTLGAIEAAFQAWADVECSTLAFEFLDDQAELFPLAETNYSAPSASKAEIYVFWVDGEDEPIDFVGGFDNVIGHTFPRHDGNGKLTTASIAINARGESFPLIKVLEVDDQQFFDVQTVVLQLLGDVIGLAESDVTSGTVMKKGPILTGIGERAPLEDDQSAMQFLYWDDTCSADKRPPDPGADQVCYPTPVDAGTGDSDAGAGLDGSTDAPASCETTDQCAAGEICSAEGECVTVCEDDGCSCATKGHPARAAWSVLALIALALVSRARRRS